MRALAGMVSDYRADLPAQGLPASLLDELKDQIGNRAAPGTGSYPAQAAIRAPGPAAVLPSCLPQAPHPSRNSSAYSKHWKFMRRI